MSQSLNDYYSSLLEYTILKKLEKEVLTPELLNILNNKSLISFEHPDKSSYDISPLYVLQSLTKKLNIEPDYVNLSGKTCVKDPKASLFSLLKDYEAHDIEELFNDNMYLPSKYNNEVLELLTKRLMSLPKNDSRLEKIVTLLGKTQLDEHSSNEMVSLLEKINTYYKSYTGKSLPISSLNHVLSDKTIRDKLIYISLMKQVLESPEFKKVSHDIKANLLENNTLDSDKLIMPPKLLGDISLLKFLYFNILKQFHVESSPALNKKRDIRSLILKDPASIEYCKKNKDLIRTYAFLCIGNNFVLIIPKSLDINEDNSINYFSIFQKLFDNREKSEFRDVKYLLDDKSKFMINNLVQSDIDYIIDKFDSYVSIEDFISVVITKIFENINSPDPKSRSLAPLSISKPLTVKQIIQIFKIFSPIIKKYGIEAIFSLDKIKELIMDASTIIPSVQQSVNDEVALLLLHILQHNRENIILTYRKFDEPSKYVNTVLPTQPQPLLSKFERMLTGSGKAINPIQDVIESFTSNTLENLNNYDDMLPFDKYKYTILNNSNELIDIFDISIPIDKIGGYLESNRIPSNEEELMNFLNLIYDEMLNINQQAYIPQDQFTASEMDIFNNSRKRLNCCANKIIQSGKISYIKFLNIAKDLNMYNPDTILPNREFILNSCYYRLVVAININTLYIARIITSKYSGNASRGTIRLIANYIITLREILILELDKKLKDEFDKVDRGV